MLTCGATLENNATYIIFKSSVGSTNRTGIISHTGGINITFSCVYPIIQSISMPMDMEAIGGCPNSNDGTVAVLRNGVSTSSYFSLRMFTFTGFSTKIYLHCQVHLCLQKTSNCALSLARLPHTSRVGGSISASAVHVEFACSPRASGISSGCSGFLPQSKNMRGRLIGISKLSVLCE
ncbi:hypothetical protein QTP70_014165 [Hemibagrus guttatus]|uniref:ZP domain-containing protein n=1 Tax=Hemibagrus guttatus TaxID=175788 RepID=A0AAE0QQ82_9TELE|nr:hypothetical protein QTP70_014165 [Hemibagrus guttatus]